MSPDTEDPLVAAAPAETPVAETVAAPADAEAGTDEAAPGDRPGDIPFDQAVVEHETPELG